MTNKRSPTGRFTQSEPVMQNIPVRTSEGAAIKKSFLDDAKVHPDYERKARARYEEVRSAIVWCKDPDDEEDLIGMSGEIEVARIKQSRSGRWRWEVAGFPGMAHSRDEHKGWAETEGGAKAIVQAMWFTWLKKAGLK